jgi:hypothetical protein
MPGPLIVADASSRSAQPDATAKGDPGPLDSPVLPPPRPAAGVAGLADPHRPATEDPAMTDDEIMRQLS